MENAFGGGKTLLAAGLSSLDTKLVIESNVTPAITIDLAAALASDPRPNSIISDGNRLALRLMQPEIEISTLGGALRKTIAPHGRPRTGAFTVLLFSIAAAGLVGAGIAWNICKRIN